MSFGRFRRGGAGTLANRAFAGRRSGNPYSTRVPGLPGWRSPFYAGWSGGAKGGASSVAGAGENALRALSVCSGWRLRAERLQCPAAMAGRRPTSFGRFRRGGAGTRANWAFADRYPGNPYSTRVPGLPGRRSPFYAGWRGLKKERKLRFVKDYFAKTPS